MNPSEFFDNGGADVERLRILDQVESLLVELREDQTGQPVIAMIDRTARQHAGSRAAELQDLLVHYRAGFCPGTVSSPRLGRIEAKPPGLRPGNHSPGGFLIVVGDKIDASEVTGMQDLGTMAINVLNRSGALPTDMSGFPRDQIS